MFIRQDTSLSKEISFRYTSSSVGRTVRLQRIFRLADDHTIILPFDHALSNGPIADARQVVTNAVSGGADALLLHPGLARSVVDLYGGRLPTILMLTASGTPQADHVLLGSVEQAVKYAADAVCVEFKLGSPNELATMSMISQIKRETERYDLPLMISAYTYSAYKAKEGIIPASIRTCHIAVELGADIIKTPYPGTTDGFRAIIEVVPVPIVIAGGILGETQVLLKTIAEAMQIGAAGVAIGRNIWEASDPQAMLQTLYKIVHGDKYQADSGKP